MFYFCGVFVNEAVNVETIRKIRRSLETHTPVNDQVIVSSEFAKKYFEVTGFKLEGVILELEYKKIVENIKKQEMADKIQQSLNKRLL